MTQPTNGRRWMTFPESALPIIVTLIVAIVGAWVAVFVAEQRLEEAVLGLGVRLDRLEEHMDEQRVGVAVIQNDVGHIREDLNRYLEEKEAE